MKDKFNKNQILQMQHIVLWEYNKIVHEIFYKIIKFTTIYVITFRKYFNQLKIFNFQKLKPVLTKSFKNVHQTFFYCLIIHITTVEFLHYSHYFMPPPPVLLIYLSSRQFIHCSSLTRSAHNNNNSLVYFMCLFPFIYHFTMCLNSIKLILNFLFV